MLFKEGAQLFVGHVQTTAVYPCQIGAFWIPHLQRSDGVDLLAEIIHIGFDVGIQLIQPLVALGVCSNDNRINKDVAAADVQVVEQLFKFVAQIFILDDDVGSLKTCQVEGLAGSGTQDGAVSQLLGNVVHHDVVFKDKVVVDFVCNQIQVVFEAEVCNAFQLFAGPYTTDRVVRAAQHEGFGVWSHAFFHVLKVDGVVTVVVDQRTFNQLSAAGGGSSAEWTVNRGEDHDLFARFGDSLYAQGQCNDNTWSEDDPVFFNVELMAALHPVDDCLIVFVAQTAVGINVVSSTFFKSFVDWSRSFKVHVRNPHWQHLLVGENVPFGTVSSFSVVWGVKLIHIP